MTKTMLACALSLALAVAACSSNPTQTASSSATPAGTTATVAQAAPAKPKLVCESDKPLGSNLPQRICMTPEEAAARQRAAQDRIRNMQNQSAVGPGMGSSSGG